MKHVKNLHVEAHVQPRKGGRAGEKVENDITLLYQVKEGEHGWAMLQRVLAG